MIRWVASLLVALWLVVFAGGTVLASNRSIIYRTAAAGQEVSGSAQDAAAPVSPLSNRRIIY